jgi:hypothetical protein
MSDFSKGSENQGYLGASLQRNPQIDTKIAEIRHFRTETN